MQHPMPMSMLMTMILESKSHLYNGPSHGDVHGRLLSKPRIPNFDIPLRESKAEERPTFCLHYFSHFMIGQSLTL